jgi:hypothetical protein
MRLNKGKSHTRLTYARELLSDSENKFTMEKFPEQKF